MDKIENLKNKNGRFYYDLSRKYFDYKKTSNSIDAGFLAIPFLKKACEIEENGEYYYALASMFKSFDSMFESNTYVDYLMLALKNGFDKETIYKELLEVAKDNDNDDAISFYSNLLNITKKKGRYNVVVDNDEEYFSTQLKHGTMLSIMGNYEDAIDVLSTIDNKKSIYFTTAINALMKIYIEIGAYEKAEREFLKLKDDELWNSGSYALYMLLKSKTDPNLDLETIQTWLSELRIESDDTGFDTYLSVCCNFKFHKLIVKRCLRRLNQNPYDVHLLYIIGIAYLNLGQYEDAKEFFRKGSIIRDLFGLFSYYYEVSVNLIVDSNIGNSPMVEYQYDFDIPLIEEVERKGEILDSEALFNREAINPSSREGKILDWVLLNGDEKLVNRCLERLTFKLQKEFNPYLEKIMLSSFYSGFTKRRVMYYYLLNNPSDVICYNNDGIYKELKALKYKDINANETIFRGACHVYSCLVKLFDNFEDSLVKTVIEVKDKKYINECKDENIVAYYILKSMLKNVDRENLLMILDLKEDYIKEDIDDDKL